MSRKTEKYIAREIPIRELNLSDLEKLSDSMGLALNIEEMRRLQEYFAGLGRNPTDVEIQAMAQAWSEHCGYKSSRLYLKRYLSDLRTDYTILAMEDDAGVVEFDEENAYVIKMESHNHPSAVEPYGGAATGIGGVIRDVLCMGAQPVALLDSLYFGNTDYEDRKGKHLSTRFLMNGIVSGIRDYGNRIGIPTVAGSVDFHPGYNTNPLINAGCFGIAKKSDIIRSFVSKVGDILVIAGGRTGRDGLHGVNFASRSINTEDKSNTRSVQLGNPIIAEPLIHAIIEVTKMGIVDGMKDLGGGGLSSAVGELCFAGGVSAEIHLENLKLKEEGMEPWEIWVSESQERMVLAIEPGNLDRLARVMDSWDVEYSVLGSVTEGNNLKIFFRGTKVLDLDLRFLTSGPVYARHYIEPKIDDNHIVVPAELKDYNDFMISFMSSPQMCSRQRIIRLYDFTVRASTVVPPLTGLINSETHSDSTIIKPLRDSNRGLSLTTGAMVKHLQMDPYNGTMISLSEAYRNTICSGSKPHSVIDSLNFGNPEDPEIMGQFVESVRAIGDFCRKFNLPVVSGNVSLYNESEGSEIIPTPTIFMAGIVEDVSNTIPSYFQSEGSIIAVVGKDSMDLCGSEYVDFLGKKCTSRETVDLDELNRIGMAMGHAAKEGLIKSAHDVAQGGIAACIAEMSFGLEIGANVELSPLSWGKSNVKLFSEGGNRIMVEIAKDSLKRVREIFSEIDFKAIGETGGSRISISDRSLTLMDIDISKIKNAWISGMDNLI